MKRFFILIILLFSLFNGYSSDIKNYELIFIKTIPIGKEEGNIGFLQRIAGGMPRGPETIAIDKYKNLYIPDFANSRINVYDLDLNYLKTIEEPENKTMHHATKLFIDNDKNIMEISAGLGLKKINQTGETILYLDQNKLPENIRQGDFFVISSYIIYYDDNGFIKSITPDGEIRDSAETSNIIREIEKKEINNTSKEEQKVLASKRNVLIDIQSKGRHIIIGDKYYTTDFLYMKDYFEKGAEYYAFKKSLENEIKKENININEKSLKRSIFIGFDDEHNSYWRTYDQSLKKWKEFVFVYSNYGEIIDAFYFENLKDKNVLWGDYIKIAIAPSGDVYFMRNDETGSYFWKVERRW